MHAMALRSAFALIPAHPLLFTTYSLRVAVTAILIVALVLPVAAQQYPSPPFSGPRMPTGPG